MDCVEFENPLLEKTTLNKINTLLKKPSGSELNLDKLALEMDKIITAYENKLEMTKASFLLRENETKALHEKEVEHVYNTKKVEMDEIITAYKKETIKRQYLSRQN